jgi:hypothetical protein
VVFTALFFAGTFGFLLLMANSHFEKTGEQSRDLH